MSLGGTTATVTSNPVQSERLSPGKSETVAPQLESEPTNGPAAQLEATEATGGFVDVKDLLLDIQAHRGINRMCFTLVMVYVGFRFLGELTHVNFANNNVQLRNWCVAIDRLVYLLAR